MKKSNNLAVFLIIGLLIFIIDLGVLGTWIGDYPDFIELRLQPGQESWLTVNHSWQTKVDHLAIESSSIDASSNLTALIATEPIELQPIEAVTQRRMQANLCGTGLKLKFNSNRNVKLNWTSESSHPLVFELEYVASWEAMREKWTEPANGQLALETGPKTISNSRLMRGFIMHKILSAQAPRDYTLSVVSSAFNEACDMNSNGTGVVKLEVDFAFESTAGHFEGTHEIIQNPKEIPIIKYHNETHIVLRNDGGKTETVKVIAYLTRGSYAWAIFDCIIFGPLFLFFVASFPLWPFVLLVMWCLDRKKSAPHAHEKLLDQERAEKGAK